MTELATFISKRAVIKGQLTRFQNLVESIPNSTAEQKEQKLLQLPLRLTSAQPLLEEFNQIQFQIDCLNVGDDEVAGNQERDSFENGYYTSLQLAKNLLARQNPGGPAVTNSNAISNSAGPSFVSLPKIDLPIFSGDYQNWLEFRDTFNSLIHSNVAIGNIQKFHYLKASFKGTASNIIQSVEFSEANYMVAWQQLLERYDDQWLIIYNHVKAIFNLPSLTKENFNLLRQLHEDFSKHLHSLKILGEPVEQWDTLLIYILSKKLDPVSKREWENFKYTSSLPKVKDMQAFLKGKCRLLEKLNESASGESANHREKSKTERSKGYSNSFVTTNSHDNSHTNKEPSCAFCKKAHSIYQCEEFLQLPVESRIAAAKDRKLCINCLRAGHFNIRCRSSRCKHCGRKHNALLHLNITNNSSPVNPDQSVLQTLNESPQAATLTTSCHVVTEDNQIILPTAIVKVLDSRGGFHNCRALLDSASQSNFITEDMCQTLGLQKRKVTMKIIGISQLSTHLSEKVDLTFQSSANSYRSTTTCIVTPSITGNLPNSSFNKAKMSIPPNIRLADNGFNKVGKIDLLIGAQIFFDLICIGQIKLANGQLILQKTKLGWVFSGPISLGHQMNHSLCNLSIADRGPHGRSCDDRLHNQLEKFWSLEECNSFKVLHSSEEKLCEEHFISTTKRDSDGRFIVSVPLKEPPNKLGDSKQQAIVRFQALERKLSKNANFKQKYIQFMREYENLGHMSRVSGEDSTAISFYLPHHGVLKENNITTKLRVVFDGSAKSTTGISLNNLQMVGPVIQDDLFSIILRFRKHKYVLSADVEKMYRQVLVEPKQRNLQRIVWRENPSEPLKHYSLNTVTYGTAAGSFLAIRALQQLGYESAAEYPEASAVILRDFYVDDLLTGSNSIQQAMRIRDEIANILLKGQFKLRKWISNEPTLLKNLPESVDSKIIMLGPHDDTKTLGLVWLPKPDIIVYNINLQESLAPVTKRSILASVAKIFDPLGLLAPSIILPKIIMQKLWQCKVSWDESVPNDLHTQWSQFKNEMLFLQQAKIPRFAIINNAVEIELHGFSDASQSGYGACIYIRSKDAQGNICVRLLCAKSKVAPIKTISIPRLELCGALLLARLMAKTRNAMSLRIKKIICWCDSTVAIAWIRTPSNALKIFVGNRVSEIQDLTTDADWRHVSSGDNPADPLSRGIMPKVLLDTAIWWEGPRWLSLLESNWPLINVESVAKSSCYTSEKRSETSTTLVAQKIKSNLFERFSSLERLKGCIAYCFRFKFNSLKPPNLRRFDFISVDELNYALHALIKISQREEFVHDLNTLAKGESLKPSSKLLKLNPFLDNKGILRVGGRLTNSEYAETKRHPILIPKRHRLTYLIVKYEHERTFHSGPQLLLASLRELYWPIGGRYIAKSVVNECMVCFRIKPKASNPLMGSLPYERTVPSPPFDVSGVDYCGPILIKDKKGRGCRTTKAYICLFICFSVKAIHIELVSDLTTDAFIAALKRFISRRGRPSKIFSDNGTNFVGADAALKAHFQELKSAPENKNLINFLCAESIAWKFIPPRSPHFGGLWEAGVKTVKGHLRKVVGNAMLTFEELQTILTQIEAVVNSRPLSPLSSDPNDPNPLTPAHFLIGRSLMAIPEPSYLEIKESRLSRYQRVQQIIQHFWKRWSREYIGELQCRTKWRRDHPPSIKEGTLVIIRDDNVPVSKWHLGRVVTVYPGTDGIVRVAQVKTVSGTYKRAINKLCPLPLQ